jgi:hypothetical protein
MNTITELEAASNATDATITVSPTPTDSEREAISSAVAIHLQRIRGMATPVPQGCDATTCGCMQ